MGENPSLETLRAPKCIATILAVRCPETSFLTFNCIMGIINDNYASKGSIHISSSRGFFWRIADQNPSRESRDILEKQRMSSLVIIADKHGLVRYESTCIFWARFSAFSDEVAKAQVAFLESSRPSEVKPLVTYRRFVWKKGQSQKGLHVP
jgi:hypothetical protein